jgi:uncharacterized membrane protein required for colicin V production
MHTAVIIDVIAAAVLLGFLISGAMRGLFRSLAGLLIVVLALVGAGIFSDSMTPTVAKYLQPYIEKRVEQRVDKAISGSDGDTSAEPSGSTSSAPAVQMPSVSVPSGSTTDPADGEQDEAARLLALLGLDQDPSERIENAVQEKVRDTGVSVLTALVESLAENVIRMLLFAISFFLLMLVLKLLMHAIDLVLKMPGLHFFNHLGGAAIGVIEGALVLFLGIWALRRFGVSFDTETVQETILLQFFTTHTPLSVLSFL